MKNSNTFSIRVNTRLAVEAGGAAHKSIKNEKQSDSYVCLLPAVLCRRGHCLRFTNNLCVAMSMSPAMPGVDYPVACTNRARVGWPVAPTPQNYYPFSVTGVAPVSLREPVTDTNPLRATPLRDSRTTITRPPRPSGRAGRSGRRRKKAPTAVRQPGLEGQMCEWARASWAIMRHATKIVQPLRQPCRQMAYHRP
jgi:hypothetical protein